MAREIQVYGVTAYAGRYIVAARSKAEVSRLITASQGAGYNAHYLSDHGDWTGNDQEIAVAMSRPGVLFYEPDASLFGPPGARVWVAVGDVNERGSQRKYRAPLVATVEEIE